MDTALTQGRCASYRSDLLLNKATSSLCRDTPALAKTLFNTVRAVDSAMPSFSAAALGAMPGADQRRHSRFAEGQAEDIPHQRRVWRAAGTGVDQQDQATRPRQQVMRRRGARCHRQYMKGQRRTGFAAFDEDMGWRRSFGLARLCQRKLRFFRAQPGSRPPMTHHRPRKRRRTVAGDRIDEDHLHVRVDGEHAYAHPAQNFAHAQGAVFGVEHADRQA